MAQMLTRLKTAASIATNGAAAGAAVKASNAPAANGEAAVRCSPPPASQATLIQEPWLVVDGDDPLSELREEELDAALKHAHALVSKPTGRRRREPRLELWPLGAAAVGHSSSGSDSDSDGCIPLLDLGRRRLYQPPDTVLYEAEANMVAPSPEALLQTVRACCLDPVVQRAFMQNPSVMTLLSQLHHHPGPLLPAAAAAAAAAPECGWGDENPRTARSQSDEAPWRLLEEAVRELCAGVTHVAGSAVQTLVTAARHAWRFFHPPNPLLLEERVCVHLFATCDFGVLVDLEVTPAGAHSTRKPRTPAAPPHEEDTARVIEAVMALTVLVLSLVLMKRLR